MNHEMQEPQSTTRTNKRLAATTSRTRDAAETAMSLAKGSRRETWTQALHREKRRRGLRVDD